MRVLVTGAAGFIGNETARVLLERGDEVVGIDNLNDYYDPALKLARLARLDGHNRFSFETLDLADRDGMAKLFAEGRFERVVHLGAQAGVRFSIDNPQAYLDSNLTGFGHVLEGCRRNGVEHLVYASSSSVYGANTRTPFRVEDNVDHPVSLYAATKKANEGMAHAYAHLYGLPTTGLRFFTVYGPWGRPDMAPMIFTRKILAGEPIEVFNEGKHERDFTYVDDIVEGVVRVLDQVAAPDPGWSSDEPSPATSSAPWRLYNIGNSDPVPLMDFIATIEQAVGRKAVMEMKPRQPGDVLRTAADVSALEAAVGFRPHTPLADGIGRMVRWYRDFYRV
ncbi:NAD-dependent epimerase [Bosea vestrisii]|uniref:NAD-dependent epimerase n=1 Tax=Bosea vestrisii TaxID=151416 RepID=UPI0024DFE66F|nr:NAD-dependent epimerase [Bosea vestrisii]WID97839.1 NAD-dependent epimerase [Bosea vestrisii]